MNKYVLAVIVLLAFSPALWSQSEESASTPASNIGIIYSASDLLLDLQSYEGGVGLIWHLQPVDLRLSLNMLYNSNDDYLDAGFSIAVLKPILQSRVNPYWGGFFSANITTEKDGTDDDTWVRTTEIPLALAGIFGAEFFILPHVSLFAEYQLYFEMNVEITRASTLGIKTDPSQDLNYEFGTGLGNSGMLGIIIYLGPQRQTAEVEPEE